MKYNLQRDDGPFFTVGYYGTLAEALEASGVPPSCWNAVVASHPDEICTFFASPGIVPGGGAQWTVRAPGVAAEFTEAERAAGRLVPLEIETP